MREERKRNLSRRWLTEATTMLLCGLLWTSAVLAVEKQPQPSTSTQPAVSSSVCPSGYRCLTETQYLEVVETIQDLRQALHTTTLDLAALRAPTPALAKARRISFGPSIGIALDYSNGQFGFRPAIGVAITWDWYRSK